ncbi:FliM/FliN family flagellar motor switch protein [Vibrio campbellii]
MISSNVKFLIRHSDVSISELTDIYEGRLFDIGNLDDIEVEIHLGKNIIGKGEIIDIKGVKAVRLTHISEVFRK